VPGIFGNIKKIIVIAIIITTLKNKKYKKWGINPCFFILEKYKNH
jgi:hypothetical protein